MQPRIPAAEHADGNDGDKCGEERKQQGVVQPGLKGMAVQERQKPAREAARRAGIAGDALEQAQLHRPADSGSEEDVGGPKRKPERQQENQPPRPIRPPRDTDPLDLHIVAERYIGLDVTAVVKIPAKIDSMPMTSPTIPSTTLMMPQILPA